MKLKDKSSEGGEIAIEVSYMKESHDALFARMRRARGVALAGYAVSPDLFLAGVSRYDGRFITPYLGMSAMQGGESTRKDPRVMTSAANWKRAVMFTHRVHWRQHYPLLDEDDFVVPEENNRISALQPKDESMRACEDLWGWREATKQMGDESKRYADDVRYSFSIESASDGARLYTYGSKIKRGTFT